MACENVASNVKIKMKQKNLNGIFFSEIFGNFQFFVEKKNFSPAL